jgi:hypothetical protein
MYAVLDIYNDEPHDLYRSFGIVGIVKSRRLQEAELGRLRMKWAGSIKLDVTDVGCNN